jgi:hypothetical protein
MDWFRNRFDSGVHTITISLTVDGVCIGNWIYWNLTDPLLQVIITVSLIHILYISLGHTDLLRLLCLYQSSGNGFQWRTFPFLWVPELSPASATSFSQQQLTTEPPAVMSLTLHWLTELKSKLLYDRLFTANEFIFAPSPLKPTTRDFFQLNLCGRSPYVTSSLTREWIRLLWICLASCQVYVSHTSI